MNARFVCIKDRGLKRPDDNSQRVNSDARSNKRFNCMESVMRQIAVQVPSRIWHRIRDRVQGHVSDLIWDHIAIPVRQLPNPVVRELL